MYLKLITTDCKDRLQKFQMVKELYDYTTRNINLGDEYRIVIKSRNTGNVNYQTTTEKTIIKTLSKTNKN